MARYFSREGVEQTVERINNSKEHLELAQNLTGKVLLVALNDPDGNDLLVAYTFDRGKCVDWVYEAEKAPSALRERAFKPMIDGMAKVTAEYETFVKLDKGEIEAADTIDRPDYKIEANMIMILPMMQAVDSWNRQVRAIDKDY